MSDQQIPPSAPQDSGHPAPPYRERRPSPSFFGTFRMVAKAGVIVILSLLLLIPTYWIYSLINEREERKSSVIADIESKWSGKQTFYGPLLILPYTYPRRDNPTNTTVTETGYAYILPDNLNINGDMQSQVLHRSIYTLPVYSGNLAIEAVFKNITSSLSSLNLDMRTIEWSNATLCFQVSDMRGIQEDVYCRWNNNTQPFSSGVVPGSRSSQASAMLCKLHLPAQQDSSGEIHFSFNLPLRGSDSLFFAPAGAQTQVEIRSPWNSPAFDGASLPSIREVSDSSFRATWKVQRPYGILPSVWHSVSSPDNYLLLPHVAWNTDDNNALRQTTFGVRLVMPVSSYQITTRAVKYAIMIIGLTFMLFFFIEVLGEKSIHPFQYILVGLALVIFYSLLLSFSEHWSFTNSYLCAAGMTILLVTFYTRAITKDRKFSVLTSGALVAMYAFVFTILQMEDYSLMVGSLGLFLALAAVMYFSRTIDWYGIERKG